MLLEGSYLKDVEKIIEAFRLIRREMINDGIVNVRIHFLNYTNTAMFTKSP